MLEDDDMVAAGHDILVLQNDLAPATIPAEVLHQKGYATLIISDFNEILKSLRRLKNPIFIVNCPKGESLVIKLVKSLIQLKGIHAYPLILVGPEVDSFESLLEKYFPLSLAICTPCNTTEILQAVTYTVNAYPRLNDTVGVAKSGAIKSTSVSISAATLPEEAPSTELAHRLYNKFQSIPQLVFDQIESLHLKRNSLHGSEYSANISFDALKRDGYLPHDSQIVNIASGILRDAGKWGERHLCRTAFVSCKLTEALGISGEELEQVKGASLLFAWSFAGNNPALLHDNYLQSRGRNLRSEICSRVKDSAMRIIGDLRDSELGVVVATMARLIGREEVVGDDRVALMASAVMISDLVDRVCFHSGYWDPRAAYSLMHRFKSGSLSDLHPLVSACAFKFLSETISTNPASFIVPKHLRDDPMLLEAARRTREQQIESNETKVAIESLQPGMKLTRPIFSFDGRKVLSGNLVLDHDLIWRIWQLSALRPLNGPLVIQSEN